MADSKSSRRVCVPDHISRKELKQDKIRESIEHGAEAVYSHGRMAAVIVLAAIVAAAGYGGWRLYSDRKNVEASAAFDAAMKAYSGRIGAASEPGEIAYPDDAARSQDAAQKFTVIADKYPGTNPGKLSAYYAALCLEDLERHNQALEELKRLSAGSDKELAAMAQYQTALIYARTGKSDEAIKLFRGLADKGSVFVPRPLVLLELAGLLRKSNPQEAAGLYKQIKKEFPDTAIAEEAERGLDMLSPKS
jgi:predicted negative regulator of RcsB-dependent stress response